MPLKSGLTILGSNSSIPNFNRMCTSHIFQVENSLYMIDCGEGTQLQLTKFGISRNKIKAIFISHFHGDHLYGLPGLLTSYMHFSRTEPLLIVGPKGLKKWLDCTFEISQAYFDFEIEILETDTKVGTEVYKDDKVRVETFELFHRIPTQGYVFTELEKELKIRKEKISEYQLSVDEIIKLKRGETIDREEISIKPEDACFPKERPGKYVFMSDTIPLESIPESCMDANLLYHEATYLHDMKEKAIERGHSTSIHAALTAQKANARQLILGHFSSRYLETDPFLAEAKTVFDNTFLAEDGQFYPLHFNDHHL
ncbi:MAG: ribonuclease Z [Saprospiraceae bacterium]|nr:ribonuclease Z [Saprospiraceae bacterium]